MYSTDLRAGVIRMVDGGMSRRAAARIFGVSPSTAVSWLDQWRRGGVISSKGVGGDRRSGAIEAHENWLMARLYEAPDTTLEEFRSGLKERGLRVGLGTVWRFFDRCGISVKKNRARRRTGPAGRGGGTTEVA